MGDAMLIGLAGLLLILPGYLTDVIGLLLLLPPDARADLRTARQPLQRGDDRPPAHRPNPGLIELDDDDWRDALSL